jgi:hypothetical protein
VLPALARILQALAEMDEASRGPTFGLSDERGKFGSRDREFPQTETPGNRHWMLRVLRCHEFRRDRRIGDAKGKQSAYQAGGWLRNRCEVPFGICL